LALLAIGGVLLNYTSLRSHSQAGLQLVGALATLGAVVVWLDMRRRNRP
jgi:hypothetical protein